ncbi:MAG: VOC family protein [Burkholderiaceae bacterium]|nr:VOC family protein [Burkholderiaceae bacterium]
MSPLAGTQVGCMLPVKDMARARRFYEQQLALDPIGARPDGKFGYRCGGTEIWLLPRAEGTKAQHTALGFRVDNLERAIAELQRKDVRFADYDLPGLKTVNHIARMGAEKAAWFEDTEGNFLCVHEDLD